MGQHNTIVLGGIRNKKNKNEHNLLLVEIIFYLSLKVLLINSLTPMGAHERPLFDKLLWWLVTLTILSVVSI